MDVATGNPRKNPWLLAANIAFIVLIVAGSVLAYVFQDRLTYFEGLGYFGVLTLCFLCNATVFAPAPSLAVVMSAATFLNPVAVALMGAAGSTLGETMGYLAGMAGRNVKQIETPKNKVLCKLIDLLKGGRQRVIFTMAAIPLPLFDIVGFASGYLKVSFWRFITLCFLGKLLKISVSVAVSVLVLGSLY
ncbi:MAG: VTT domain-containing protein [Coriobacteriales bacterium]|jgi:membrane protein YqaA with SNARE-associated domain|nr:VTT domain-containing protein [Coriobacteriales bacterium]